MERWYDPAAGEILLDGLDIKSLNVRWLRRQIGYVQQEPVLFNASVYENVAHGLYGTEMDNLPEKEKRKLVEEACIEANADVFIQGLPEGYNTNVGERGALVSGGQKQRIAVSLLLFLPMLAVDIQVAFLCLVCLLIHRTICQGTLF